MILKNYAKIFVKGDTPHPYFIIPLSAKIFNRYKNTDWIFNYTQSVLVTFSKSD